MNDIYECLTDVAFIDEFNNNAYFDVIKTNDYLKMVYIETLKRIDKAEMENDDSFNIIAN